MLVCDPMNTAVPFFFFFFYNIQGRYTGDKETIEKYLIQQTSTYAGTPDMNTDFSLTITFSTSKAKNGLQTRRVYTP